MVKLGIDLGGTNIAVGVVDEQYHILGTASVKTDLPRSAEAIADSMKEACLLALGEARLTLNDVSSVGVGTPGAVNEEGVVEFSANLGFLDTPLRDLVEERLGKPTYIENDANCAALGEAVAGCGGGVKDFVAVTLGTGVGGGIVLGGKLLTGINGAAGEIGHMVLEKDGIPCPCGRCGCFEQYASATALIRQTREAMEQDREKTSRLWALAEGDHGNVNGLLLFNAAHEGDERALQVLDKYLDYLAEGVADLINIFQPEVLCIGGGISKQGDFLIAPLTEKVEGLRYTKHSKKQTRICAATLGNDAGIIGAALLADVK
ncbi:MAG: ROK family glucokinase [Clostridia bacterium]|nr:ROK family glucokinase [Clostridia bacterium]